MRVQRFAKPLGMRGHRGSSHSPVEADIGASNVTEELQTALICAQEIPAYIHCIVRGHVSFLLRCHSLNTLNELPFPNS